ncbi:hypothetical protein CPB83DRAFT_862906 [Crepidotus variabilis]|uniref:Uncharacterized protein n=1 Tax=Crepidotus variabilis TaxID=179855 RepID=A0A9P6E6K7_9AGAR|nr:hypothetical protein CPB83DRAFT_862906 [Crepidotus variabilis]
MLMLHIHKNHTTVFVNWFFFAPPTFLFLRRRAKVRLGLEHLVLGFTLLMKFYSFL